MAHLLLKEIPRYDCLLEASQHHPELDPSAAEVFLHLLRAGDEAFRVCRDNLERHGISQGRFSVLMQLNRATCCGGASTPAELAEAVGVTRATMTGLIDTLMRDGYVTREPDAKDRRMVTVTLTEAGIDLIRSILPTYFNRMAELMMPLSESERQTMLKLLRKIITQASTMSLPAVEEQATSA
jgi:DNA-binding MarR family transcriptional regulator